MLPVEGFGQIADFQQRRQILAALRLWAGIASFTQVLSGKNINPFQQVVVLMTGQRPIASVHL
ncbi:hypothetical protein CWS02_17645 [Enterobacter sp. EA-1]|nr:hypothetical protein CWS02_17645 [Enterobacter sp. EA-1]